MGAALAFAGKSFPGTSKEGGDGGHEGDAIAIAAAIEGCCCCEAVEAGRFGHGRVLGLAFECVRVYSTQYVYVWYVRYGV